MIHPLVSANKYIDTHIKQMLMRKGFKGGSLRSKLTGIKQSVKNHWEKNKHVYKYAIPATVIAAIAATYLANRGGNDNLSAALNNMFLPSPQRQRAADDEAYKQRLLGQIDNDINDPLYLNDVLLSNEVMLDTKGYMERNNATVENIRDKWERKMTRALSKKFDNFKNLDESNKKKVFDNYWNKYYASKNILNDPNIGSWVDDIHSPAYSTSSSRRSSVASIVDNTDVNALNNPISNEVSIDELRNFATNTGIDYGNDGADLSYSVLLDAISHVDPNNATVKNIRDSWERKMMRQLGKEYLGFNQLSKGDKKKLINTYWNELPNNDVLNYPDVSLYYGDDDNESVYSADNSRQTSPVLSRKSSTSSSGEQNKNLLKQLDNIIGELNSTLEDTST